MKEIILKVDDEVYNTVVNLFSLLPKNKVKIEEKNINNKEKILKLADSLKNLPIDPVEYQKNIRKEWS